MFKWFRKHTSDGREIPDTTPLELSLDPRPLTIQEQIARFCRQPEVLRALSQTGRDTYDEAQDIDPDDEGEDFISPYTDPMGVQTRMDEQRGGISEEMPLERQDKARNWFRKKPSDPPPGQSSGQSS